MAEHLDAYEFAARSCDMLLFYLLVDGANLVHIELACQDHNIGKLGVEAQCLNIGDVELGREVNLHIPLAAIGHHRHVAGDDSRYFCLGSSIDNGTHGVKVFTVDNGIDGEV